MSRGRGHVGRAPQGDDGLERCRLLRRHPRQDGGRNDAGDPQRRARESDFPFLDHQLTCCRQYFELHRGTATSHGSIKFGNRKSEILLREIEFAATLASVGAALGTAGKGGKGHDYLYPKDQLDRLWEGVLTNQFHDILPGSSIGMVYVDAEAVSCSFSRGVELTLQVYADVREKGSALLEQALRVLVPHSVPVYSAIDRSVDTEDQRIIAINTTPFPRRELALVPVAMAKLLDEEIVQVSHDGQAYVMIENVEGGVVARATTTKEFVASGRGSARGTYSRHPVFWLD